MRSLCLNVELEGHSHEAIDILHDAENSTEELIGAPLDSSKEEEEDDLLGSIAAELGDILNDDEKETDDTIDLIGKGEEM